MAVAPFDQAEKPAKKQIGAGGGTDGVLGSGGVR